MANSCNFNAFYCEIRREIFKVGPSVCLLGVRHLLRDGNYVCLFTKGVRLSWFGFWEKVSWDALFKANQ